MSAVTGALLGVLGLGALAVAQSLLAEEAKGWLPHVARALVRSAARQLPPGDRNRYEDEWLAEVAAWSDRPLSAVAHAAHIRWRARVMTAALAQRRLRGFRAKRAMDLALASTALFVLAPALAVIALAIVIDSRGPIFERSRRLGRAGAPFECLRFRTIANRDGDSPRLTTVGRILRSSALDELPQLFNVLRGEMSLVGPRAAVPVRPRPDEIPGDTLAVPPGLTGPAQHARLSFEEAARVERQYAESWSLRRDVQLLLKTVRAVFEAPASELPPVDDPGEPRARRRN